jgi:hypothetical protein
MVSIKQKYKINLHHKSTLVHHQCLMWNHFLKILKITQIKWKLHQLKLVWLIFSVKDSDLMVEISVSGII